MNKIKLIILALILPLFIVPLSLVDTSYGQQSPPEFKSYYDQLSDAQKDVYDVCVDPFGDGKPMDNEWSVLTSTVTVSATEQGTVDIAAKVASLDNPGYFWLWNNPKLNEDSTLTFEFINEFDKDIHVTEMEEFADKARIDAGTEPSFSAIINTIDSKLREKVELETTVEDEPSADNAYSAIVKGKASSLGFAAAFTYCFQEIYTGDEGKDVVTIYGKLVNTLGSQEHAWNAVNEGEGWFGVDVALNEKLDVSTYLMMSSNSQGHNTDYTFEASHQPNMAALLGIHIFTPEIQYIKPIPPPEPSFLEKWGSHIIIITITAVLCAVLISFARRS